MHRSAASPGAARASRRADQQTEEVDVEAPYVAPRDEEFAAAEVFAAHHAIVIEHPNLDMAEAALFDNALGILNGFHVSRIEHKGTCVLLL